MATSDRDHRCGVGRASAYQAEEAPVHRPEFETLLDNLSNLAGAIDNDLALLDGISIRVIGPRPKEESVNKITTAASHTYTDRLRELVSRFEGIETRIRNSLGELLEAL